MELQKFLKTTGLKLANGDTIYSFITTISLIPEENVNKVMEILQKNQFVLETVPCSFLKVFCKDGRELEDMNNALAEINALNLKDLFMSDIKAAHFTMAYVSRVKEALSLGLAITNQDGRLVSQLNNQETFEAYKNQRPVQSQSSSLENKEDNFYLDMEDLQVKDTMMRTLSELKMNETDGTLGFIINHIENNLDMVIKNDNKRYLVEGFTHLIDNALDGLKLTMDMQNILNMKVYPAFSYLDRAYGRGSVNA